MTECIFYRLKCNLLNDFKHNQPNDFPILLGKAYDTNQRISIQCGSEEVRDELNKYLWTWKEDSFLPHGVDIGGEYAFCASQPILLTASSDNANSSTMRFFIDQASMNEEDIGCYNKLFFIIDESGQEVIQWGRDNFLRLKNAGYKLTYYENVSGIWKKK